MIFGKINSSEDIPFCLQVYRNNYDIKKFNDDYVSLYKILVNLSPISNTYKSGCIVIKKQKEIIGFGCYHTSFMDYNIYEIDWINIKKEYQHQGMGIKLIKKIEKEIIKNHWDKKEILLLLVTDKTNFYSQIGFNPLIQQKDEFYVMMKRIKSK